MKTGKYSLVSAFVAMILCVPALGNVRMLKSGERQQLSRPWGALSDLDTIDLIDMTVLCSDPNKDAKLWQDLYDKVAAAFSERIRPQPNFRSSLDRIYKICIEILGFEGSPNYAARVQSSLTGRLPTKNGWTVADVWTTAPAMKVVPIQNLHETVSAMVMEQVEEFVSDYQKAKQTHPQPRPSDANDANSVAAVKEPLQQTVTQPATEYQYIASKNRPTFHKPDCRWAKRISPENLVGYKTRDDAINAGKKPCKQCKP